MSKIKETFGKLFKKATDEVDDIYNMLKYDIQVEQEEIGNIQYAYAELYAKVEEKGINAPEEDTKMLTFYQKELARRTDRVNNLLNQLNKAKEIKEEVKDVKKKGLSPDTVFTGLICLTTCVLAIYAEESRPLISKGMSFIVRPRL